LSIDEIWSFKSTENEAANEATEQADDTLAEEVVEFDGEDSDPGSASDAVFVPDKISSAEQPYNAVSEPLHVDAAETTPSDSGVSEYEMLEDGDQEEGSGDPILDELEAEIARELED